MNAFIPTPSPSADCNAGARRSNRNSRTAAQRQSSSLEMKVSETMAERIAAFRLVHRAYCAAGLTAENEAQMRVLKHHLLDTTDVLVGKRLDEVKYTVSLVRDGEYGVPSDSLFGRQVSAMRAAGKRVAEVSCFACNSEGSSKRERFDAIIDILTLIIQTGRRRGVDRLLLATHPRHAKVYQRLLGCVAVSDVRGYEAVQGNPAILCMHDYAELDRDPYPLYDRVWGTHFQPWQLDGIHMTDDERKYFARAINEEVTGLVPMAA